MLAFRLSTADVAEGTFVVTIRGEADSLTAPELEREFDVLVGKGTREVIVDLLEVPFIDSTILEVLLRMSRRLRADGADLVLVTDDPRVLRTFEISGLLDRFRFEPTLSAAVESALAGTHG